MNQIGQGKHYFVSYSYKDLGIAKQLREDLEKKGFRISMGEHDAIRRLKIIQQSSAVLYLVSPTSRTSSHVRNELEDAKIYKINIIPLLILKNTEWNREVASDLFTTKYVDLRGERYTTGIGELIHILDNLSDHDPRFTLYVHFIEKDDDSSDLQEARRTHLEETHQNTGEKKPSRTQAFISYCRKDKQYLQEFQVHLQHYVRRDEIKVWDDTRIPLGSRWRDEIKHAIQSTKVAVLLVSADFLASDFIANHELSPLLEATQSEGVTLLPVILKPCAFHHSELAPFQAFNRPSQPLALKEPIDRDSAWSSLAQTIWKLLTDQSDQSA